MGTTLLLALGGGLGGIFIVGGLSFLWYSLSYLLRGYYDPCWRSEFVHNQGPPTVHLVCKVATRPTLSHLGAIMRMPTGEWYAPKQIIPGDPRWFLMPRQQADPGEYEVRWYSATPSRTAYEIARGKFDVPAGQTSTAS